MGGLLERLFDQMGPGFEMTNWSCHSIPAMPTFEILLYEKKQKLIYLVTVGLRGEGRCDAFPTEPQVSHISKPEFHTTCP